MDSDLYQALAKDDIDVLKGKDRLQVRHQLTPANNTVLHLACRYGSIRCVREILNTHESLLLRTNSRGETALHLAARQGHYGSVEALVNMAKSSDLQPKNLENTSSTVLQNLIRASNVEFETALHAAVRYSHKDVVRVLVKEDPSYSYPRNKYDETPLYLAAIRSYYDVIEVILDNCESPTFGGPHGRTALHAAATVFSGEYGDSLDSPLSNQLKINISQDYQLAFGCMRFLLAKNKDLIKVADDNGWTVFHFAADNKCGDLLLQDLLDANKSVAYLADKKYKRTPLHVAAYKGHDKMVEKLLKYLPDACESLDGNGQNILHIALMQDRKLVIELILSLTQRFDIFNNFFIQRDNEGNTPLHLIAKLGYYSPELRLCIFYGDFEVVDNTNLTPPEVLYQNHHGTLVDEVGVTVDRRLVNSHWDRWTRDGAQKKGDDPETTKERIVLSRQMANSQMIVAGLVTTVALTAGFAMPGGFDGNQGPNQGSPLLIKKTAFKIFMVADTVALVLSISSLFLYFLISLNMKTKAMSNSLNSAVVLNVVSIAAMMVAFIGGTYAVLSDHSMVLAISVCTISSLFILLVFFLCFKTMVLLLRIIINQVGRYLQWKFKDYKGSIIAYFRRIKRRNEMLSVDVHDRQQGEATYVV